MGTGACDARWARALDVRLVPRRWGARRGASLRIAGAKLLCPAAGAPARPLCVLYLIGGAPNAGAIGDVCVGVFDPRPP